MRNFGTLTVHRCSTLSQKLAGGFGVASTKPRAGDCHRGSTLYGNAAAMGAGIYDFGDGAR